MTKYFLNSGAVFKNSEKGIKFFNAIFQGLGAEPKLLVCYFAQPREDWEERFKGDQYFFAENFKDEINPVLSLAFPENFAEQISNNDIVYIHGGDDNLILYWLKKFNLPKIWENKIVAGSSAGANALVKSFWTCDWRKNMDGLGIIPAKFLAHFKSDYGKNDPRGPIDWEKAKGELEKYGDVSLPIYALEEGDYQVFEI